MDRLEEWRLFAAVATQRSFAKAARVHGKSPQAATRAVAALESRLRTRLLSRTTRSVALTDDGARALERAQQLLAGFDQLEAGEGDQPLRGSVGITAPVLFGQRHVAPLVGEFLGLHPELSVRLLLVDRPVSFVDEAMDLGVRVGVLPDSTLKARLVGSVRPLLCASPAYLKKHGAPRSPEELARHDCIAFTGTTPLPDRWAFAGRDGKDRSVAVRPRLTVNSGQAAIDAALNGLGVVRVLSYQVDEALDAGALQPVLERFSGEPVPVHLLQPAGAPVRAATRFADFATERLRERLRRRRANA